MIKTKEYSQAATEVIDVLQHMDEETIEKIPLDFIKMLNNKKDKEYIPNIDYSDENEIKNIKTETKIILAMIYRDYLCDNDERKKFDKQLTENQEEINKKYEIDFKKNKSKAEEFHLIPVGVKESFWKRFFKKIFRIK